MPGFMIAQNQSNQKQLPRNVVYTYTWDVTKLLGEDMDKAVIYLKEANLPSFSIDTESIKTGHATYEFAKGIKWQDIKLTFYDTQGLGARLDSLSRNVWDPVFGIQPAEDYMAQTIITMEYMDGTKAYSWTLHNSWIKSISFSRLTYESTGINNVNVSLAYTWATRVTLGASGDFPKTQ